MTLDAMIAVAEMAWVRQSPCWRCPHLCADRDDPEMAACAIADYDAAPIEECPAVSAAIEQEIDDECAAQA